MTLDTQAAYITECQRACRTAKESRSSVDLEKARALLDSHRLLELPKGAQENLRWAYADALLSVTGALS